MKISCVIVHYNNKLLSKCVSSLLEQSFFPDEIIIINNGSLIEEYFNEKIPICVINNQKNLFYSQALNMGISRAQGEYILCLNDDVFLDKDFLMHMVKIFNKDSLVGMVSGKVLSLDGKTIDSTGLFLSKSRRPVDRGYRQKDCGQFNKEEYIFGVPGAVGLYKKEMLKSIEGNGQYFDSSYGMFYEDLDLCWRAQKKGWKAYYVPKALAYHYRGSSAKTVVPKIKFLKKYEFCCLSDELKLMVVKNRYKTIIKNDSFRGMLFNLPFIIFEEIRLWSYLVFFAPKVVFGFLKDFSWITNRKV